MDSRGIAERLPLRHRTRNASGFTLLELMIVSTILAILAGIGVPQYRAALRTARFAKAKQELQMMSAAIDSFLVNENRLPLTLYEVGHGGRRDPWGVPYCYLNYESGTGDGLEWAVSVGVVDPSAVSGSSSSGSGSSGSSGNGSGNNGNGKGKGNSGNGNSGSGSGSSSGSSNSGQGKGIGSIVSAAASSLSGPQVAALVHSLKDAPADASVFTAVPVETARRRDQYLFPLNTDYDLFSLGPNGQSAAALNDPMAIDDVIRANNGGFFGVASDY